MNTSSAIILTVCPWLDNWTPGLIRRENDKYLEDIEQWLGGPFETQIRRASTASGLAIMATQYN